MTLDKETHGEPDSGGFSFWSLVETDEPIIITHTYPDNNGVKDTGHAKLHKFLENDIKPRLL